MYTKNISCALHTLTMESEVLMQTDRPHLGLSMLFDYVCSKVAKPEVLSSE